MAGPLLFGKLFWKQLKRLPMVMMIKDLVAWKTLDDPVQGYSVVISAMRNLAPVAIANLKLCAITTSPRLKEIIVVFDCLEDQIPEPMKQLARDLSIPVRLVGYDERQHRVTRSIDWGWVYAWLSWSLGIGHAKTRAVIIHDLDAMVLAPDFFERLYDHWLEENAEFCGIYPYLINGVTKQMGCLTTFELTLNAEFLRRTFRPFDLFNKLRIVDGHLVDFDTMLNAQWRSPRRALRPIDESTFVHPSQLICQYTDLMAHRTNFAGKVHGIPVLLYFLYIGGEPEPMMSVGPQLESENCRTMTIFGREAFIDGIAPENWAWMEKLIRRLEQSLYGETRPEIEAYLREFVKRAGAHRTVGVESGRFAVPDR